MPYIGNKTADTVIVEDNSVTSAKIVDSAVTTAKINNDAVTVDKLNLISTSSVPSLEAKGTSGVTEGYIQLNCAENSHGIKLKSPPHSAGASYTLTFPNNDGNANQVLTTDGSGVLSFADAPSGGAWQLIYSDNVTGHAQTNAYSNSNLFSSTYDFYRVYILDWEPQNDGVDMNLQFTLGGSLRTSNYKFHLRREESDSSSKSGAYDNSAGSIRIMEGCGNNTSESMSGWFEYQNPTDNNGNYYITQCMYAGTETNGNTIGGVGQGQCVDSTGAMTGFTISAHSGGLGNYKLRAYGLKQS